MNKIYLDEISGTKTFSIGGGEWSIEVYNYEDRCIKEFCGSNGTRSESDDLWAEYYDWCKTLEPTNPKKQN